MGYAILYIGSRTKILSFIFHLFYDSIRNQHLNMFQPFSVQMEQDFINIMAPVTENKDATSDLGK